MPEPEPRGLPARPSVLADDVLNPGTLAHRLDVLAPDQSRHRAMVSEAADILGRRLRHPLLHRREHAAQPGVPGTRGGVRQAGDLIDDHSQTRVIVLSLVPGIGQDGVDGPPVTRHEGVGQVEDECALAQVDRFVLTRLYDVAHGDSLEQEDLRCGLLKDDE